MKYLFIFCCFCVAGPLFSQASAGDPTPSQDQLDSLRGQLETLFRKDQTFRRIYLEAEEKLGKESFEMEYFWQIVEAEDKVLEAELSEIVDTYGWLGISQVGRLANTAQWAVLQHGSPESKEKYAPLLKASVLGGESQARQYADLVDWMRINAGQPQLYGIAIQTDEDGKAAFYEIEAPSQINERRREIGLTSIEEFAASRGLEWTVEQEE